MSVTNINFLKDFAYFETFLICMFKEFNQQCTIDMSAVF